MHICIYIYMCVCVCVCVCMSACRYLCMYMCMYVRMYVWVHAGISIFMYYVLRVHVCNVCMYIYVILNTCIHILWMYLYMFLYIYMCVCMYVCMVVCAYVLLCTTSRHLFYSHAVQRRICLQAWIKYVKDSNESPTSIRKLCSRTAFLMANGPYS